VLPKTLDRDEAVTEIGLRRRADADSCAGPGKQPELAVVGVRGVNDRRAGPEAAGLREEVDRPDSVFREAFFDLARLLVCVDVEDEPLARCEGADLLQPVFGAGADGVGGEANADPRGAQILNLLQIRRDGTLAEALDSAPRVGGIEEHEFDPRRARCLRGCLCLLETKVMKLPDRRVPGRPHLPIGRLVALSDHVGGQTLRMAQHGVPPPPEVVTLRTAPHGSLKGVAVRVDESGQRQDVVSGRAGGIRIGARLPFLEMATRAVPAPLSQLPNALTVARLAAIPIFIALVISAGGEASWAAGILFGAAGATDQIDGWLARRWRVESEFGRFADPLADRLIIDSAVILLWYYDRLPWPALVLILVRDGLLVLGTPAAVRRGYEFSVNFLGKAATWILYASIAFILVTDPGTTWPLALFWVGVAVAFAAGAVYLVNVIKVARR
jgi:CDP-diacylglycerol--glycerol-3-phosphate 3-phosphatidyltransferase